MKERFKILFDWITNIGNLLKVGASVVAIGAFTSGMIAKHNANILQTYIEKHKAVTISDVDSIVKLRIEPIFVRQDRLFANQIVMKDALADHMSKDKSVTKDDLLNFMRQFQLENEKKNNNSSQTQSYIGQ
jgi:hypothetical protein